MDLMHAVATAHIQARRTAAERARARRRSPTRGLRWPWLQRRVAPTPTPACATC